MEIVIKANPKCVYCLGEGTVLIPEQFDGMLCRCIAEQITVVATGTGKRGSIPLEQLYYPGDHKHIPFDEGGKSGN